MACFFDETHPINYMLTPMLIGLAAPMMAAPPAAIAFFLGLILSLKALENKQLSLALVPKLSTGLLPIRQLKFNGFSLFLKNLAFSWQHHPPYGVIILEPPTLQPISCFTLVPST